MYARNPNLAKIAQVMNSYAQLYDAMTVQRRELLSQTRASVDKIDEDRQGLDTVVESALRQGKPGDAAKYIDSLSSNYLPRGQPEPASSAVTAQPRDGTHPRDGKIYEGDLVRDVRKYIAVRTRQEKFPLESVAGHFGYRSRQAPVAQILKGISYLTPRRIKGKLVFVRE